MIRYVQTTVSSEIIGITLENPTGLNLNFPADPDHEEYQRMQVAIQTGKAELVEVDDTPVTTYVDDRIAAYANTGDQLDMQYHDAVDSTTTWKDHVSAVKAEHPKP